jgi:hypothetical protein
MTAAPRCVRQRPSMESGRRPRRATTWVFVAVVFASTTPSNAATTRSIARVIGAREVAGLHLSASLGYPSVARYFRGSHATEIFSRGGCDFVLSSIGLRFEFGSLDALSRATPSDCTFIAARVSGRRWHTKSGLAVGAPVSRLKRLFPRAYAAGLLRGRRWGAFQGAVEWILTPSSSSAAHTQLVGYVRDAHLVGLGVTLAGH